MITAIRKIDFDCKECSRPAAFEITRTNDDLPDGYWKEGTRAECYCRSCLPIDAYTMWRNAEASPLNPPGVG